MSKMWTYLQKKCLFETFFVVTNMFHHKSFDVVLRQVAISRLSALRGHEQGGDFPKQRTVFFFFSVEANKNLRTKNGLTRHFVDIVLYIFFCVFVFRSSVSCFCNNPMNKLDPETVPCPKNPQLFASTWQNPWVYWFSKLNPGRAWELQLRSLPREWAGLPRWYPFLFICSKFSDGFEVPFWFCFKSCCFPIQKGIDLRDAVFLENWPTKVCWCRFSNLKCHTVPCSKALRGRKVGILEWLGGAVSWSPSCVSCILNNLKVAKPPCHPLFLVWLA